MTSGLHRFFVDPAILGGEQVALTGDQAHQISRVLRLKPGDRVVYIAPNTHANLEGYYAVPMLGAVLVPVNYRLTADDYRYVITHSGASVVCAHGDYLDAVDSISEADKLKIGRTNAEQLLKLGLAKKQTATA